MSSVAVTLPLPDQAALSRTVSGRPRGRPDRLVCRTTVPSPSGITRSHKSVGPTAAIAVALPPGPDDAGRIYAGLPVANTAPALCASARFDPIASRQALDDTPWNRALNELVGDLRTAAVLWRFRRGPSGTALARRAAPRRHTRLS
jgi:hypothetical protein